MFCAKCGTEIAEGGNSCPICGAVAGGEGASAGSTYMARK